MIRYWNKYKKNGLNIESIMFFFIWVFGNYLYMDVFFFKWVMLYIIEVIDGWRVLYDVICVCS